MDVISNWNPDDTTIPPKHFASLCRFHYQSELSAAKAYREAEVPFIVYGKQFGGMRVCLAGRKMSNPRDETRLLAQVCRLTSRSHKNDGQTPRTL